ncbi:hypothetical protein ELI02_18685 [Rhizobium leguminosarum]|uniref:hypothetical protein n=1 Tax=Rhizobium leguminosarum TaxID=384 RepID=UPI0010301E99|nr:hypothetical protein [Rhizobium leguminosarum]TAX57564.1 hypothetical protein ELI01_21125 [Rhizobium leguminosarum]TAX61906.1 hypothetical protein ELI02_18685 [Rhizobium leguminosarum]TAY03435.1 hypothetical protein ELH95_21190 [Rhizobium leguminosarum]
MNTWKESQQTIDDAAEAVEIVRAAAERFARFCYYSERFELQVEFHETVAYIDGAYRSMLRITEDNYRVANGRGRRRGDDYPEDFIGPTGFITF